MPLRCASPSEKLPPSPDPPDRQPVFCSRQLSRTTRTPKTQEDTLPHTATGESSTSSRRSDGKPFVRGGREGEQSIVYVCVSSPKETCQADLSVVATLSPRLLSCAIQTISEAASPCLASLVTAGVCTTDLDDAYLQPGQPARH